MGVSVFPAPAAGSKTRYVVTLLSGTSYTVPAGVTYVNATLMGGGGGSGGSVSTDVAAQGCPGQYIVTNVSTTPGSSITYAIGAGGAGASQGGTTSFTGAASAVGGLGGRNGAGAGVNGTSGSTATNGGYPGGINSTPGEGGAGKIELEYWV